MRTQRMPGCKKKCSGGSEALDPVEHVVLILKSQNEANALLTHENYLALRHCRAAGFFYTDRKLGGRCHGAFRPELEAGRIPAFDWNNASTDWSLLSRIDYPNLILFPQLNSRHPSSPTPPPP